MQGIEFLGENIRRLRKNFGMTQTDLAHKAGISFRGLQDIERGMIQSPRAETLRAIAGAFGLEVVDLYRGWSEPSEKPPLSNIPIEQIEAISKVAIEAYSKAVENAKKPSQTETDQLISRINVALSALDKTELGLVDRFLIKTFGHKISLKKAK